MIEADRNLLFGILALQVDFVTPEALIDAMRAWSREKHKPLGQILVERGALAPRFRELLEPMVDAHIARNGGEAARSLEALSTRPSALPSPGSVDDPDLQASLARVAAGVSTGGDSLATRLPASSARDPAASGPRFRVLRPHARGGIGEVFVAHDRELNREVALKEIQGRHADDPGSRSRFLLEAEVTGGLEHPGIVPVYGLGHHEDGRPFYAMRFIRGDSLKDAIEGYHRGRSPGLADRPLALRKLLRRFLDVCDAIAYAHERGVIHRDLKPGNIMLGQHGETLVVDWGLAKAQGRAEAARLAGEDPLAPGSGSGSVETLPGSTIGTPSYMSPEQAAGHLDRLGTASDVYSLGATLYTLLTGSVPFRGPADEVLRAVQLGGFRRPREVVPEIGPALEAICLKAMALAPRDRYESPRALAEDLERWLADEPVSAYRDPWTVPVARFCRRHRSKVVAGVSGLLALLVVGLVTFKFRAEREILLARQRTDQARREVAKRRADDAIAQKRRADEDHRRSMEEARREAAIREGFAAIARAREARTSRRPGWTWATLEELARARTAGVREVEVLRAEAVAALGSRDVRPRAVLDPRFKIGWTAHHLAYSPDGRKLAAVQFRPSARVHYAGVILDVETGAIVRELQFQAKISSTSLISRLEEVHDVSFGEGGRWLAVVTSGGLVHLWDESNPAPTGKPTASWEVGGSRVLRVAFAGGALFTLEEDAQVLRWTLPEKSGPASTKSHTFRAEHRLARSLEVGDGTSLRIVSDGVLLRLDPATLSVVERTPVDPSRFDSGWLIPGPGGPRLATIKGGEVGLIGPGRSSPLDLEPLRSPGKLGGAARVVSFDPDGSLLLGLYESERLRAARLWDLGSGSAVATLPVRGHFPIGAAFSPDGRRLSIAEGRKINEYEIRTGGPRSSLAPSGGPIRAFAVSPDGSSLACVATDLGGSAASGFEVTTWDLAGARRLHQAVFPGKGPGNEPAIASVAFGASARDAVATGNDASVYLSEGGGERWRGIEAGGIHPRAIVSGDGRRAWAAIGITGDVDRLLLADVAEGRFREVWRDSFSTLTSGRAGINSLIAAGDAVLVGLGNGSCLLFREGDAASPPAEWKAPPDPTTGLSPRDPVTALAFRGEGGWVAIGRQSGGIEVRPVAGGPLVRLPEAHREPVGALAFAPDGRMIASGSADRSIRLWRRVGDGWGDPLVLPSESGRVLSLTFGPDGRTLYALSEGEVVVRAWHLDRLRDQLAGLGLAWEGFAKAEAR